MFLLLEACLGLSIDRVRREICFTRPLPPAGVGELRIQNLNVAGSVVDLLLKCDERDVSADVIRRTGDVRVVIAK